MIYSKEWKWVKCKTTEHEPTQQWFYPTHNTFKDASGRKKKAGQVSIFIYDSIQIFI